MWGHEVMEETNNNLISMDNKGYHIKKLSI